MIKSMTAYARAEKTNNEFIALTEIRSYNSRHLDISLRLTDGYQSLEDKIKSLISDRVKRGRIEIKVQIQDPSDEALTFEIDRSKARAYHDVLGRLKDDFNIHPVISLGSLMDASVIMHREIKRDTEAGWLEIRDCIIQAIDELAAMRKREGDFIAKDIGRRLDFIQERLALIDKESNGLLAHYQERLKERIILLTKGMIDLDPGRIAQEAAFIANRSDISEELVRAASHIQQFRVVMKTEEPAGQKLNFLLQELHREFNTMGSKTEKAAVSHVVVDIKSELEKIREQVQNVE